jgi:hypothetical protein
MKWLISIIKFFRGRGQKEQAAGGDKEAELLEAQINSLRGFVMQKEAGSVDDEPLEELRIDLRKTEDKYHRLKKIHKNDLKFVSEITKDWFNYLNSLRQLHSAWCQRETEESVTANENYGAKVVKPKIIKEDTERKFDDLLGIKVEKKSYDEKEREWIGKLIKKGLKK